MNDTSASTSASGSSLLPDGITTLTTAHLAIVAVLMVLAIMIIVVGARRKRIRSEAAHDVETHAEEAGAPEDGGDTRPSADTPAPSPSDHEQRATPVHAEPPAAAEVPDDRALPTEPVAAAFDANPAAEALPSEPAAPQPGDGPVTQLKGLGPKVAARLGELGITSIGQLAALDDTAAQALDAHLGAFAGRLTRDRWVEQARFLTAGDRAGFEAVFGRL